MSIDGEKRREVTALEQMVEEKIMELEVASRFMGWLSLVAAVFSGLVTIIGVVVNSLEITVIAGFIMLMFTMIAIGNFVMYHLVHQPRSTSDQPETPPDSWPVC